MLTTTTRQRDGDAAAVATSAPPHAGPAHRRDIQGLRGVAVLLVVAFHAGLPVPGGYVGVDSFFAISGFVIMLALRRELHRTGTVSLRRFYAKRARRLLPALAVVLVFVLVGSTQILDVVGGQQQAAETARAASVFAANVELADDAGSYFSDEAERNPLLHTWSLSVEEQFYLFVPGIVLAAYALARRRRPSPESARRAVAGALWAITAASFLAMLLISDGRREDFYATPLRAWEFGVGALCAVHLERIAPRHKTVAAAFGGVGVALLALAAFAYSDATPFPSLATAVPVVGTAALLTAATRVRILGGAFEHRGLVWLGDRSYGWYLWHWPAIVFAGVLWPEIVWAPLLTGAAALIPAALLYAVAEQPIRRTRHLVGLSAATLALVAIVIPIAGSAIVERRADTELRLGGAELASKSRAFDLECERMPWPADECTYGDPDAPRSIVLLGDSHALLWAETIGRAGEQQGFATHVLSYPGCPVQRRVADLHADCAAWQRHAIETTLQLDPDAVVVANRGPAYLPRARERIAGLRDVDGEPASDRADAVRIWEEGLVELLETFDRPTLIILSAPEHGWQLHDAVRGLRPADDVPTLPFDTHVARSADSHAAERRVAARDPRWTTLDPATVLCDTECRFREDGRWLYFDDDHLSPAGARLVAPMLIDRVRGLLVDREG